jgi:hypothetical protein
MSKDHKDAKHHGPCPNSTIAAFAAHYGNGDGKSHHTPIQIPLAHYGIGTRDFTLSAWVKRASAASGHMIIASQDRKGQSNPQFRLECNAKAQTEFVMCDANSSEQTWPGFVSPLGLADEWTHVAVVRKGTHHHMYHNGVAVANFVSKTVINVTYGTNTAPVHFRVGSRHGEGEKVDAQFHGYMNAIQLSYSAASPCQLASLAQSVAPAVVHCPQLTDTKQIHQQALPCPIATRNFTLSGWVKRHGSGYQIIAAHDRAGYSAPQFRLENNKDNKLEFVICDKASGVQTWPGFVSSKTLEADKWNFVEVTRAGTKHRMFLNHEQVAEHDSKSVIDITYNDKDAKAPGHFRFGCRHPAEGDSAASPLNGELHDFKLFFACLHH